MATKPTSTNKSQAKAPAAKPPAAATAPAADDLSFDHADSPAVTDTATRETIHASDCVVNSECTLTPRCRGRLRQTNAISGKVQIYCPKCSQFAAGTRPANGLVSGNGGKLFDRVAGK